MWVKDTYKLFSSLKIGATIIVSQTNGHFFMCVQQTLRFQQSQP